MFIRPKTENRQSQVVELDPTRLTVAGEHQLHDVLCNYFSHLPCFKRGQVYSFVAVNPQDANDTIHLQVTFTHDIVRRQYGRSIHFEVISHARSVRPLEMDGLSFTSFKLINGVLELCKNRLKFVPHANTVAAEIDIDLLNLTEGQKYFLGATLRDAFHQHGAKHFVRGRQRVNLMNTELNERFIIHMKLSHALQWYKRKNSGLAFEILGDVIGEGSFGEVYRGLGVLVLEDDETVRLKPSRHVIKKILHDTSDSMDQMIASEYSIAKKIRHLHTKKPVSISQGFMAFTYRVERFLPGASLFDVIYQRDISHRIHFDTETRLDLTIALLRSLKEQVHLRGIVHRDIKPENIIVDLSANTVSIIDFGLSKFANDHASEEGVGSLAYMPLEALRFENTDALSDVYSMGVTIAALWGARYCQVSDLQEAEKRASQLDFPCLFSSIDHTLDAYLCKKVNDALMSMTYAERRRRCSLDDALERFEKIRLQHKIQSLPSRDRFVVRFANHLGVGARLNMECIIATHVGGVTEKGITNLIEVIHDKLKLIDDVPAAIHEFVSALGVRALVGANTRAEVVDKLDAILRAYQSVHASLLLMRTTAEIFLQHHAESKAAFSLVMEMAIQLKQAMLSVLEKAKQAPLGIDEVVSVTGRMKTNLDNKMLPLYHELQDLKTCLPDQGAHASIQARF